MEWLFLGTIFALGAYYVLKDTAISETSWSAAVERFDGIKCSYQTINRRRLFASDIRIGVDAPASYQFSLCRKSFLSTYMPTWLCRFFHKALSQPVFDHFLSIRSKNWLLHHVLLAKPELQQMLLMLMNQANVNGLRVRKVICSHERLWVDVVINKPLGDDEKSKAVQKLKSRWVPCLAELANALGDFAPENNCNEKMSALSLSFYQLTLALVVATSVWFLGVGISELAQVLMGYYSLSGAVFGGVLSALLLFFARHPKVTKAMGDIKGFVICRIPMFFISGLFIFAIVAKYMSSVDPAYLVVAGY